jgi:hypothetical protein
MSYFSFKGLDRRQVRVPVLLGVPNGKDQVLADEVTARGRLLSYDVAALVVVALPSNYALLVPRNDLLYYAHPHHPPEHPVPAPSRIYSSPESSDPPIQ